MLFISILNYFIHLYIKRELACDLNVNNTISLQNTRMIKTYVAIDPRVRPLILIIKHWAKQRKLNDAGKNSYMVYIYIYI